jgi:hypothetical protein
VNKLTAVALLPRRPARREAPLVAVDTTALSAGRLAASSANLAIPIGADKLAVMGVG